MDALLLTEVERCLYVPMRDGVHLAANLYRPKRPGAYPGVISRTPYGRAMKEQGEFYAARGYAFLAVDARGTGDSEGVYTYYNMEDGLYDGHDLVEWLASRPCCDGQVGTCGGSALGIYQILTGWSQPPHLRCMCVSAYPLDFYTDQWYPGGVFRTENRFIWCSGIADGRSAPGAVHRDAYENEPSGSLERRRALYAERFRGLERRVFEGQPLDWAQPYLETPHRDPAVWDGIDLTPRMQATHVPILHAGILYDHFGIGTIRGYRVHPGEKRLIMNPGSLGHSQEEGGFRENQDLLWFERHLKGRAVEEAPAVQMYDTGQGRWLAFDALPEGQEAIFRLDGDGTLRAPEKEGAGPMTVELNHDPAAPVLTTQGCDYRDFENQPGVVCFTTPPLTAPLTVVGQPVLHLQVRCHLADANIIGKLCAVAPDGSSRRLNFAPRKLSLREDYATALPVPRDEALRLTVECWCVSHTFAPGERIRLVLSLSDYPFFENAPHPGTLCVDVSGLSTLVLPVVKGAIHERECGNGA